MRDPSPNTFVSQLAETVAWCVPRLDVEQPKHCLRSNELRPDLGEHLEKEGVVQGPHEVSVALNPGLAARPLSEQIWLTPSLVEGVVQSRRDAIESAAAHEYPAAVGSARGRLLLSLYEYTNHNGLTADLTAGYFDENDVPPWDTWIADVPCSRTTPPPLGSFYAVMTGTNIDRVLVAWVPPAFESTVSRAIEEEAIGMLAWADALAGRSGMFGDWEALVPEWLRGLQLPLDDGA